MVKKKKRRKNRGKKVSLPNNVAPITIVPHESESNMLMEDDIEHDFLMPTTCCADYDWKTMVSLMTLRIFLALAWKNMIIMFTILLVPFMLLIRIIMMICKTQASPGCYGTHGW